MEIENTYIINQKTMAVLAAKHIDYYSIILETDKQIYVHETPLHLIKKSCLFYWTSFEGVRKAVRAKTNYRQKIPIPININQFMIAIPTHAIDSIDCSWIMQDHVRDCYGKANAKEKVTDISFFNRQSIRLPISIRTFRKQLERAIEIRSHMAYDCGLEDWVYVDHLS